MCCLNIFQPLIIFRHNEKSRNNEPSQSIRNPFEKLPHEVLLTIQEMLEPEYQVLFCLCCKYLFRVLGEEIDLRLSNNPAKLTLLHHLETDSPAYLTCPICATMYKWRLRADAGYQCPRLCTLPGMRNALFPIVGFGDRNWTHVRREMIDLMKRARNLGPLYGLPHWILNGHGIGLHDAKQTVEGRWVDGQLIVAACWEVHIPSSEALENRETWRFMYDALCFHWMGRIEMSGWFPLAKRLRRLIEGEEQKLLKCPSCATDWRLSKDGSQVKLKVWRSFGNSNHATQMNEQIFSTASLLYYDPHEVVERNLQTLFGPF